MIDGCMWEVSYISEYWKVLLRWTDRNVWADEEGTGWAWTVTFGRGKGKRTSTVKYQRFIYLSERAIQFSKISGCNIKIQTFPDMSALIKMQTGYIWLLSDGESALEDKETMKNLLNEADRVGIGSRKHGEKDVVELEFWFELAEKLKK